MIDNDKKYRTTPHKERSSALHVISFLLTHHPCAVLLYAISAARRSLIASRNSLEFTFFLFSSLEIR